MVLFNSLSFIFLLAMMNAAYVEGKNLACIFK